MAEPLAVDPTRLIAAAGKLTELVFPAAPSPMAVPGSDAVSSAINQTMPGIESLVSDGLPGVTASLKRTAGSMGAAGDIYTRADQALGEALTQFGVGGAYAEAQSLGAGVMGALSGPSAMLGAGGVGAAMLAGPAAAAQQLVGGAAAGLASQVGAVGAQAAAMSPQVAATLPQLVQLAPMAQQMAPMGQQVGQSVQQAASQGGQGGSGGATLASDTKPADDEKKDDEDKDKDEAGVKADGGSTDGAEAGKNTLVSAPVEVASGGRSPAGSSAIPV